MQKRRSYGYAPCNEVLTIAPVLAAAGAGTVEETVYGRETGGRPSVTTCPATRSVSGSSPRTFACSTAAGRTVSPPPPLPAAGCVYISIGMEEGRGGLRRSLVAPSSGGGVLQLMLAVYRVRVLCVCLRDV